MKFSATSRVGWLHLLLWLILFLDLLAHHAAGAVGGENDAAEIINKNDVTPEQEAHPQQLRNVLIRGAQTGATPSTGGTIEIVEEELPEAPPEDAAGALTSPRHLTPIPPVEVGSGTCAFTGPDLFGCSAGFYALCIFHDSSPDDYHSRCYDRTKSQVQVGKTLPGKTSEYVVACGPCQCYPEVEAARGTLGLKQSGKNRLSNAFNCTSLTLSNMPSLEPSSGPTNEKPSAKPSLQPSEPPSPKPSEMPSLNPSSMPSPQPSSVPTDSCIACDGEVTFVLNRAQMLFEAHNAFAQAVGCQMASIHSRAETAAVMAALIGVPNLSGAVFIGLEKIGGSFAQGFFTFKWTDGTGPPFTSKVASDNTDAGVYTNWFPNTEPNTDGERFVGIYLPYGGYQYWADIGNDPLPALYKCCKQTPVELTGCSVPEPDSFTGTVAQVKAWCALLPLADRCCVDGNYNAACGWAGKATISKGSCNGFQACNFESPLAAITVGRSSCNGYRSCYDIGLNAASVIVGDGSCTSDHSCRSIGASQATSVTISDSTCTASVCTNVDARICGGVPNFRYADLANIVNCKDCECLSST